MKYELKTDKAGVIINPPSQYTPTKEEKDVLSSVIKDYGIADEIMTASYEEFNNMSLIERMNLDQKAWNSFQSSGSDDPDLAWKSNAIRPITRNKVISIVAHLTGNVIYPIVYAQNENQEEDRDAAEVMRDLLEYACDNSDYAETFLYAVIGACINPAIVIQNEYVEIFRTIKQVKEDGSYDAKKVLDEAFSGIVQSIVPLNELYISDVYERDIQKQPFLIRRRIIDYSVAAMKYGENPKFKNVTPGVIPVYHEGSDTFYDVYDESQGDRLVEEVIYYNRKDDLQLSFVNSILMSEADAPNPRVDKQYPFSKTGFEPISSGFFYYKSLVSKLEPEQNIIDTIYQAIIDGSLLKQMPPTAIYGTETFNSNIITPGKVISFTSPDTKVEKIDVGSDLNAGYNILEKIESSMAESSMNVMQQGQATVGTNTAYEISVLEQNAKIMLGLFGRMIGFLVKDLGRLIIGDIVQYYTVGEVSEITDSLNYKNFILPGKSIDGKQRSKSIRFEPNLPETSTPEERLNIAFEIMDKEKDDQRLVFVNPELFRNMKYLVRIDTETVLPKSDNVKKALNLELFDRSIQLPFVNQEQLYKDLVLGSYEKTKNDVDKYIKSGIQQPNMADTLGQTSGLPQQGGLPKPLNQALANENQKQLI